MSALTIHEAKPEDPIATGEIVRRGDYMTAVIKDQTRINNPKTADIIEMKGGYLVVPIYSDNPIIWRSSFNECMAYIASYVSSEKE
jgi:hypothetical protein